jgi:hypothetical protein
MVKKNMYINFYLSIYLFIYQNQNSISNLFEIGNAFENKSIQVKILETIEQQTNDIK